MRVRSLLVAVAFLAAFFVAVPTASAIPYITDLAGFNKDDYNGGDITLSAVVSGALPFTQVTFEYYLSKPDAWYTLGTDSDGSNGFSWVWDTGSITDFAAMVRATAETVGETSDPKEESLKIVNIIPEAISGFTSPATGAMDISVYVVSPEFDEYFPPNVWTAGTGSFYDWGYTVVNKDPSNASSFQGTVDLISTHIRAGYLYTQTQFRLKLFKVSGTNIDHVWSSSVYGYSDITMNSKRDYIVNVPNVPKDTQTAHYVYYGYINYSTNANYGGNTAGCYYRSGDISDNSTTGSWMSNSTAASPLRAHISNKVDPTSAVQLGYSLDGGETFVYYGDCSNDGDGYFSINFDSAQAGNIAARNFMLAARAFNGAVWCSWTPSSEFILTNPVDVTVKTSLSTGGQVTVDGATTDVFEDTWYYFEPHTVSAPLYLNVGATTRDVFDNWSDGGARSHTATVEDLQGSTIVATYARESYLTIVSALSYVSGDPAGFYRNGTQIQVIAEPSHAIDNYSRYGCLGWSSPEIGSSNKSDAIFTITRPTTITFHWALQYLLEVRNDLYSSTDATTGWYAKDSVITCSVPNSVSAGVGVRYTSTGYEGTGSLTLGNINTTGSFMLNLPTIITWSWNKEYLLTIETNVGTPVGAGWYIEHTTVPIDIALNYNNMVERNTFLGWTGSGTGSTTTTSGGTSVSVTMDSPVRQVANFKREFYLWLETVSTIGGFAPDVSGWYELGSVVTVNLSEPEDTPITRYVPEWRGTDPGAVNYPKAVDNPRQAVFSMNNPIHQLVEWFPQYRVDVLNPMGYGEVYPPVGSYWFLIGDPAEFLCSLTGGDYYCAGFTGTGDFPTGFGTRVGIVVTQHSTITWNWSLNPPMPVSFWHPGEALGPAMNSRAIDVIMDGADPLFAYYDDNLDSILLGTRASSKPEDWNRSLLLSGTGNVVDVDIAKAGDIIYIAFATEAGLVYLVTFENNMAVPVLLDSGVGEGACVAVALDGANEPYVYYRKGFYGSLIEKSFDETIGQWVDTLIDTEMSWYDIDAFRNPLTQMPAVGYRKGIYLFVAIKTATGWDIQQATDEGNAGHGLSIAMDNAGGVFASYADISNFRGARLNAAKGYYGSWSSETADSEFGTGFGSSIALDGFSRPNITHHSGAAVKFARFNGVIWEVSEVDKEGDFDGPTIVLLKPDGRPVCVYFKDNVPMLADTKAYAVDDPNQGGGGNGGGGGGGGGDDDDPVVSAGGGGCFVATAAFGSLAQVSVESLTSARDASVTASVTGSDLVALYYAVAPAPADSLRSSAALRIITRSLLD